MQEIINILLKQAANMTWLEVVAVVFGLLSVWYSKQENILVYPTGMLSVLIYVYITFQYKLYADMGINGYYFIMSVYGWYHWTSNTGEKSQIPITTNSLKENLVAISVFLGAFLIVRFGLGFTDSDVLNWDSFTTATAIAGMWLMARKKLENWVAWIITDIVAVPLYWYKGLMLTSFQFFVFTILATMGYIEWSKRLRAN